MTTNVVDLIDAKKVLACDSRWSFETNNYLYFVDDSDYDKLYFNRVLVAVFAGNSTVIDNLKVWLQHMNGDMPELDGSSIIAYRLSDGVIFARNHTYCLESEDNIPMAVFSGSGSYDAMNCWTVNRCAKKAVSTAGSTDAYTGGSVRFFEVVNNHHNVGNQIPLSDLFNVFFTKGFAMRKGNIFPAQTSVAISISEAIKDPVVKEELDCFQSNGANFVAPSPESFIPWSHDEKQRFSDFISGCKTNL